MKSWSKSISAVVALIAGTSLFTGVATAQTGYKAAQASPLVPVDGRDWLERIAKSARELPYTGVFIQQTADGMSTSRITHLVDRQGVELEKLEMLDGPMTEIIRRQRGYLKKISGVKVLSHRGSA